MTIPQVNGYGNFINPYLAYLNPQMNNWNNYGYYNPTFMGVQNEPQPISVPQPVVTPQIQPNAVNFKASEQIQKPQKEGLSKGAKWGIGLGLTTLVAGGIYIATKGRAKNLDKLFNEKMVLSNLPENLTFRDAKTVEEGIRYAKEVLKIPTVDDKFSLEAINYVNKGLVDVSNANKGKLLMPKSLKYTKMENSAVASMCHNIKGNDFAQLTVNSNYFDDLFLNNQIKEHLKLAEHNLFRLDNNGRLLYHGVLNPSKDLILLVDKFLHNKPITINEKRSLFFSLSETHSKILTQLTPNKKIDIGIVVPEKQIYHEMGHLQDYFVNLKELMKVNSIKDITKIENRFLRKRDLKTWPLNDPKGLKDVCPDLYEHINNKSIQDIAGQVSQYSQEGIGEFVAEVYSGLISGTKFSDDVMALYKKYGGPALA